MNTVSAEITDAKFIVCVFQKEAETDFGLSPVFRLKMTIYKIVFSTHKVPIDKLFERAYLCSARC